MSANEDLSVFEPLTDAARERTQSASACVVVAPTSLAMFEGDSAALAKAREEFDAMVKALREKGIAVHVCVGDDATATAGGEQHAAEPVHAVFAGTWFSTHNEMGILCLYAMETEARAAQRRQDVIRNLKRRYGETVNLISFEAQDDFLEGSDMVLDRVNRVAYRNEHTRSSSELAPSWEAVLGFLSLETFQAREFNDGPVSTNMLISIGSKFVVFCGDAVVTGQQTRRLLECFAETEKLVISISVEQMLAYCGNIIEMRSRTDGKRYLVLSKTAHDAFTPDQRATLKGCVDDFIVVDVTTIETHGGRSVGSMIGTIF